MKKMILFTLVLGFSFLNFGSGKSKSAKNEQAAGFKTPENQPLRPTMAELDAR